jgi:hypothetical protein
MSWKIVRQPNGKYSRFSEVFDDFTRMNMNRDAAWALCRDDAGQTVADQQLRNADNDPHLWRTTLLLIQAAHGNEHALKRSESGR